MQLFVLDCWTLKTKALWTFETSRTTRPTTVSRPTKLASSVTMLSCASHLLSDVLKMFQLGGNALCWTDECILHKGRLHKSNVRPTAPGACSPRHENTSVHSWDHKLMQWHNKCTNWTKYFVYAQNFVAFDVIKAVKLQTALFWDVMPWNLVDRYWCPYRNAFP